MAVIRVNKTKNYTVMSNYHLKEKEMSLKAKGLLSIMLSLPDDWDYSVEGLVAICKESKTAIQGILKELESFHYLLRVRKQNKKGQFEYEYNIFEQPQTDEPQTDEPYMEKPYTVNVSQLNTNTLNTYKQNTKEINNIYCAANQKNNIPYDEICEYLNKRINASYKASTKKTKDLITARFNEGFTLDNFKEVIDKKVLDWLNDKTMKKYLRPETLFGTKFESYLNQPMKEITTRDIAANVDIEGFFN